MDDLGQRLPGAVVLMAGGPIAAPSDAEVQVELQRFERDVTGSVVLTGTVAIENKDRPRSIDRLDIRVPVAEATSRDQVSAMSAALAKAADLVAIRLAP